MYLKNEEGGDLILYRGEKTHPDINGVRSKLPSIYFGDVGTANNYAKEGNFMGAGRIYPVKLIMNNPFVVQPKDPYLEFNTLITLLGFDRAFGLAVKYSKLIEETDQWVIRINSNKQYRSVKHYLEGCPENKLGDLYFQAYPFFQDLSNIQLLVKLGYDGAIHGGNGLGSAGKPEYCVFDKSQIHYLFSEEKSNVR